MRTTGRITRYIARGNWVNVGLDMGPKLFETSVTFLEEENRTRPKAKTTVNDVVCQVLENGLDIGKRMYAKHGTTPFAFDYLEVGLNIGSRSYVEIALKLDST